MRDHIARDTSDDRVAALLAAAAAPAERPVPGEAEALAAFRVAMGSPSGPLRRRMQPRSTAKLTAVTALSAVSILGGGLAAASTGALPGAAQQTARDALARVGVTVPGPAEQSAETSATRGKSAEATPSVAPTPTSTVAAEERNGKGEAISGFATSTELTGVQKGAAISGMASGGNSKAGQHGNAMERAAEKAATPTPTTTPTSTEETSEPSADGKAKAEEARSRRSGATATATATATPQP